MTGFEIFTRLTRGEIAGWSAVCILLFLTLVQIVPVRWNPWDAIFGWAGTRLNRNLAGRLEKLDSHVEDIEKQVSAMWITDHRRSILTFARECRADFHHSSDEWSNILTTAEEYAAYCKAHKVSNGVVKADTEYICNLYQELSREGKI